MCCRGDQKCAIGAQLTQHNIKLPAPKELEEKNGFKCRHTECYALLSTHSNMFVHEETATIHYDFKRCVTDCIACELFHIRAKNREETSESRKAKQTQEKADKASKHLKI